MPGHPMRHSARSIADALGNPSPTAEQRAVIQAPMRPLLVVAGAGSGKTETMASRVVWLVANGYVEPDQVLGLTFTRKAATELAERIGRRLRRLRHVGMWTPAQDQDGAEVMGGTPTVSTYHSYAGRLVGEHALRLGVEPESRLLSEAAAWQFAAEVVERHDGPMDDVPFAASTVVRAVVDLAGEMAEHLLVPADLHALIDRFEARVGGLPKGASRARAMPKVVADALTALKARRQVLPLVDAYVKLKRSRDALDFSDQMALAATLSQRFPDIGSMERQRFRAVLLDEFQDTSEAQLVLLRHLFVTEGELVPVTAVGDPNQSIYGWRGASATTLTRFPREFADGDGDAQVLPLSTSWRNDNAILLAANITSGPLRARSTVDVELLRPRPDAGPGRLHAARLLTTEAEAAHLSGWIAHHWLDAQGRATGVSAAVLCRKRSQFDAVIDALERAGLPVEVVGLGGLLSTPEVSDIVALLWVVEDPTRGDQLMRLLTGPWCRLGAADLEGLAVWSRVLQRRHAARAHEARPQEARAAQVTDQAPDSADSLSIVEALDELPSVQWAGPGGSRISAIALKRLLGLRDVIRALRSMTGMPLADLAGEAERALGLDIEVLSRPEHTPTTARAHLDAFADVAASFSGSADRPTLGGFLSWLDAARAQERGLDKGYVEVSTDAVQVLTVHAAKGLEWDVVAVPGLVEGSFPARSSSTTSFKDGNWRMSPPADKGWIGGLSGVPYDLRGDCDGLPVLRWKSAPDLLALENEVSDFISAGGEHGIDEERRLAYVAFTRARHELLLTAPVWADPTTPRITSRFLTELVDHPDLCLRPAAWERLPEPDGDTRPANPRQSEPLSAIWPADPMAARRDRLGDAVREVLGAIAELDAQGSPAEVSRGEVSRGEVSRGEVSRGEVSRGESFPDEPAVVGRERELAILLAERDSAVRLRDIEVRVPRHLSASAVVSLAGDPQAFARDLRRPMPAAPALAARRGTAFHAWVEQHFARAAFVDLLDLPGSADDDPGDDELLPLMKERFLASEWARRIPDAIEIAIETTVAEMAIRGRIDAVFPRPGGGFTVVDWKTGAKPSGDEARVRALQLQAYRLAFARLRGLPLGQVDAAFYYAGTGETVFPDLPDDEQLATLLQSIPT
ncbi:MAG TPA: ATP-dependent DNA helicase [Dermatophilaceae bacterium]|nr:ATP-dependent DNA helicase [Dermatophilaceae bacterium]